jgi:pimeloyl-ACP methyl ester carboxylesterase
MWPLIRKTLALILLVVAFTLAAGFLYTGLQVRRVQARYPPTGRFIDVEGTRLHYIDRGIGPPVVLIHGNAGFVQDWSEVVPLLAKRYHVLALDRPGHGASSRTSARYVTPDTQAHVINSALQRLHVKCPILVGFSWGGGLSLLYALQYSGDTCGLVLIAPRAFPEQATRSFAYQLGRTPLVGDLFRHTVMLPIARRIVRDRLITAYAPDSPVPAHAAAAIDLWSRPSQAEATVWDSKNLSDALRTASQRYRDILTPAVIVVGDHDSPERESVPLSKQIPAAELRVLQSTGHFIPQVRATAVVESIDRISVRVNERSP